MNAHLGSALAVIALAGCSDQRQPAPVTAAPHFELACDSSDTATQAQLFCIRTDTRTGDVLRVNHLALPASDGPTAVQGSGTAGRFTTVCDATSTDTRSDFYCIRLDTDSGDMTLINLQKVGQLPPDK
jgi:hypothetical protein